MTEFIGSPKLTFHKRSPLEIKVDFANSYIPNNNREINTEKLSSNKSFEDFLEITVVFDENHLIRPMKIKINSKLSCEEVIDDILLKYDIINKHGSPSLKGIEPIQYNLRLVENGEAEMDLPSLRRNEVFKNFGLTEVALCFDQHVCVREFSSLDNCVQFQVIDSDGNSNDVSVQKNKLLRDIVPLISQKKSSLDIHHFSFYDSDKLDDRITTAIPVSSLAGRTIFFLANPQLQKEAILTTIQINTEHSSMKFEVNSSQKLFDLLNEIAPKFNIEHIQQFYEFVLPFDDVPLDLDMSVADLETNEINLEKKKFQDKIGDLPVEKIKETVSDEPKKNVVESTFFIEKVSRFGRKTPRVFTVCRYGSYIYFVFKSSVLGLEKSSFSASDLISIKAKSNQQFEICYQKGFHSQISKSIYEAKDINERNNIIRKLKAFMIEAKLAHECNDHRMSEQLKIHSFVSSEKLSTPAGKRRSNSRSKA